MLSRERDVPYSPSFVIPLSDVSPSLRNLKDLTFLPGFHSPTLAFLFSPTYTWAGRYGSSRDNFCLEVRTIDFSSGGTYPLLTSISSLPSDCLYLVPCPSGLGGIVIITATGVLHIDQSGRTIGCAVNAWWSYATSMKSAGSSEDRKLSLGGSKAVFVTERDMLLVLQNGNVHQVRFEMDGRAVGNIKVDEQSSEVPPPSEVIVAGEKAVFVASAEGDSWLAKVNVVRETVEVSVDKQEKPYDMEVDYDEGVSEIRVAPTWANASDLYGDSDAPVANGHSNGVAHEPTGPAKISMTPSDVLSGIGKILDMEFGIAATDQGVSSRAGA